jgi:prepilin-type N-terminal cleavage/methylation domain-containing protein
MSIKKNQQKKKGFTLVELIVSVGIFSVVMVIAVGALLSIVGLNRKARIVEEVMQGLHFSVDSMVRSMRVGTQYVCGSGFQATQDCPDGGTQLSFEPFGGDPGVRDDQVVYRFLNNQIQRSVNGGTTYSSVTPPGVVVENFQFFVEGTDPGDTIQPHALIIVKGYTGTGKERTDFNLETLVTQRNIDIAE